jgi:hypothetical protein
MKRFTTPLLALVLALPLLHSGCALFNEMDASSTEQLLVASGFQVQPANTPQKQAALAAVAPYQLKGYAKGNTMRYLYADPKQNVAYIGGPTQYAAYQKMLVKQGIAEDQAMAAAEMQMLAVDQSAMWDPFYD